MAHHNFDQLESLRKYFADEPLGATGEFPRGKLNDHDEGEIRFAVAADPETQTILVDFGKPVHTLGMNQEQAEGLIETLQKKVWELRGIV